MSQPILISQSPAPAETSVVLGHLIQMQFDQAIDPTTLNDSTFSLIWQGDSLVFDADNLSIKSGTKPTQSKQYLTGKFTFPSPDTAIFTSNQPLRPKTEYTVLVAGGTSVVALNVVKNPAGEKLKQSYTWKFTTTDITTLTGTETPVSSPLVEDAPALTSDQIRVMPRRRIGTDITEAIEIWFPDDIDPDSLDPAYSNPATLFNQSLFNDLPVDPTFAQDANPFNDVVVSVEAINNDPRVTIPSNLSYSVSITKNVLTIHLIQPTP